MGEEASTSAMVIVLHTFLSVDSMSDSVSNALTQIWFERSFP